ncbi:hypothetical protein LINPERHAP2_LOCUS23755 [Linum perenne]
MDCGTLRPGLNFIYNFSYIDNENKELLHLLDVQRISFSELQDMGLEDLLKVDLMDPALWNKLTGFTGRDQVAAAMGVWASNRTTYVLALKGYPAGYTLCGDEDGFHKVVILVRGIELRPSWNDCEPCCTPLTEKEQNVHRTELAYP